MGGGRACCGRAAVLRSVRGLAAGPLPVGVGGRECIRVSASVGRRAHSGRVHVLRTVRGLAADPLPVGVGGRGCIWASASVGHRHDEGHSKCTGGRGRVWQWRIAEAERGKQGRVGAGAKTKTTEGRRERG